MFRKPGSAIVKLLTKNLEKQIKSLYRKKTRYEENLCVCEGLRACRELYVARPDLISYGVTTEDFNVSEFSNLDFYFLPNNKFEKISSTINSQGIIFIAKIPVSIKLLLNSSFQILLDKVADPGNFGTILRTAASVGLKELCYIEGSVDPYSEKTIRSAVAAQFRLNLVKYTDSSSALNVLSQSGYERFYRAEPSGGVSCFEEQELFNKSVIIFGNEATGSEELKGTIPLNIPMPGKFESINVAQAATVILFEAVRRKIICETKHYG